MAKIDVAKIVRSLERELKLVLQETLGEMVPDAKIDKDKLFKAFKERIDRHFRRPEEISDDLVEVQTKN